MKATRVLLASAARTADATSAQQNDRQTSSVRLYLNVTVAPGAGGLQVIIRAYDPVSGSAIEISEGGVPVTQTGVYVYEMQPWPGGDTLGNVREVVNRSLPFSWDVLVKHGDSSSFTYSLSAEVQ